MMTIICQYNCKDMKARKSIVKPISALVNESKDLTMEPIGIVRKTASDDLTWQHEEGDTDSLDFVSLDQILQQSVSQFAVTKIMKMQSKTATQLWTYMQYVQLLPVTCSPSNTVTHEEKKKHKDRLKCVMNSWKFALVSVDEDGNCFFTSVALALLHSAKDIVTNLGVSLDSHITTLMMKLRQLIVQEWLGPNRYEYEEFICDTSSYESEAHKFLANHFYNSDLGNTMPLAMANALGVCFIVFTSQESSPTYYITPRQPSNKLLYIAYTAYMDGHYDGCVPLCSTEAKPTEIKCRCGVNMRESNKENYIACNNHPHGRQSTCKCLAAGKACSKMCKCKSCSNPNGERITLGKRKRVPHQWQTVSTSNSQFALTREELAHGPWSDFETILFVNSLRYLQSNMMECTGSSLCTTINAVVNHVQAAHFTQHLPDDAVLRHKSVKQCDAKLHHYTLEKQLFDQITI